MTPNEARGQVWNNVGNDWTEYMAIVRDCYLHDVKLTQIKYALEVLRKADWIERKVDAPTRTSHYRRKMEAAGNVIQDLPVRKRGRLGSLLEPEPPSWMESMRVRRGVTQCEVAKAMAISQPAVAKMEAVGNPTLSRLKQWVEALGGTLVIGIDFPAIVVHEETITLDL